MLGFSQKWIECTKWYPKNYWALALDPVCCTKGCAGPNPKRYAVKIKLSSSFICIYIITLEKWYQYHFAQTGSQMMFKCSVYPPRISAEHRGKFTNLVINLPADAFAAFHDAKPLSAAVQTTNDRGYLSGLGDTKVRSLSYHSVV